MEKKTSAKGKKGPAKAKKLPAKAKKLPAKAKKVAAKSKKATAKKATKKVSATVVKRSPNSTKVYNALNKLKVVDLKIMLEKRKLPKTGKKEDLIIRLMDHAKENPEYSSELSPKKKSPKKVSPAKTAFLDMEFSEDRQYDSGEESDSNDGLLYSSPGSSGASFGSSEDWTGATFDEDEDDDLEGANTEMGRKVENLHRIIPIYNFLKDMTHDELVKRLSSRAGRDGIPELKGLKRAYKNDLIGYLMVISGYYI